MRRAVLALAMMAGAASADEIYLRSGGHLSGVIVRESASSVEIEIGAGVVTIPRALIQNIVQGPSALAAYQARARALSPNDVAGWLELAEYARTSGLTGQARDAYRRVLVLDPNNAVARHGLGYRRVGEQWLTQDEAMQAQGYVHFEGEWVTPVQRDAVLAERESARRERLDAERSRAALAEAEARAREAEARARAAEADAKRAEERQAFVVYPGALGWPCGHAFHVGGRCDHVRRSDFGSTITSSGFSIQLGTRSSSSTITTTSTDPSWPSQPGVRAWSTSTGSAGRAQGSSDEKDEDGDDAQKRSPAASARVR
jgi:hypothetical protein